MAQLTKRTQTDICRSFALASSLDTILAVQDDGSLSICERKRNRKLLAARRRGRKPLQRQRQLLPSKLKSKHALKSKRKSVRLRPKPAMMRVIPTVKMTTPATTIDTIDTAAQSNQSTTHLPQAAHPRRNQLHLANLHRRRRQHRQPSTTMIQNCPAL